MTVTAFQQANQLLREGKLEAAVIVYRQAIEQNPDSYLSYQNLGETLGKLGRLDQAVEMYRKAIELKPSAAWSYWNLGQVLEQLQKQEEAKGFYQRAVDLEPGLDQLREQLSDLLLEQKQQSEIQSEIQQVEQWVDGEEDLNSDPWLRPHRLAEQLQEQGKIQEAITAYHQAINLNPSYFLTYHNLGEILQEQDNLDAAIDSYYQAIELQPNYSLSYLNLGRTLAKKGEIDEAIFILRKALDLEPQNIDLYLNLSNLFIQNNQLDEAVLIYKKALKKQNKIPEICFNLAELLDRQNKLNEALKYYHLAYDLEPYESKYYQKFEATREKCQTIESNQCNNSKPILDNPEKSASIQPHEIGMDACLKGLSGRGFYPKMVLDIGAARGDWTQLAVQYWPDAEYFMIEPLQENEAVLQRLTSKTSKLNYVLAAAGSEKGTASLGVSQDLDGSSLLWSQMLPNREVPVVSVDTLLEHGKIKQPDFIKIDVQGYEWFVFQGSKKALEKCSLVLVELNFSRFSPVIKLVHECIEWLTNNGFVLYEIVDVLRRPLDHAMGQCDLLFCKNDHPLILDNRWNAKQSKQETSALKEFNNGDKLEHSEKSESVKSVNSQKRQIIQQKGNFNMNLKQDISQYLQNFDQIGGWFVKPIVDVLLKVNEYQNQHQIKGSVAEIGVYQGKSFIPLCSLCRQGELALAVDCFEEEQFNIDRSGIGCQYDIFISNLEKYAAFDINNLRILKGDSGAFKPQDYIDQVEGSKIRVFSIDGGHTAEATEKDLINAYECIQNGGVIIIDDYFNPSWPGVSEGVNRFLIKGSHKLKPFFIGWNKIMFTHPQHTEGYIAKIIETIQPSSTSTFFNSRVMIMR